MTRAISSICLLASLVVLVLVASSSSALAAKKDKIAILGLEVVSQGSAGIDSESTRVAQELTVGLRTRPKSGQGPYAWTPQSEKELIDEKLMNGCDNEEKTCMATIGKNLGTDLLLYGKIERKSQGNRSGYQISLRLLKISNQSLTTWTDFIPLDESQGTKLQDWARKGYKKLTNENDGGTLLVMVNVDRGTILIEGEERGNISSGKGEVGGLTEGRYKVSVVSTGYRRWDSKETIAIRNGETTTEKVILSELKDGGTTGPEFCDPMVSTCENTTTDGPKGRWFWKGLMIGGLVMSAGGGIYGIVSYREKERLEDPKGCATDGSFCGFPDQKGLENEGDKQAKRGTIGAVFAGVGGAIAIVGLIKGFVLTGSAEKKAAGSATVGKRARKGPRDLVFTPVFGPQSAGATLRFDW